MVAAFYRTALSILLIAPTLSLAAPERLDSIVAIVNDGVVTEKEVRDELHYATGQLPTNLPKQALRQKVLDKLILDSLQMQYAQVTGIQIDELALDDTIASIAQDNGTTITGLRETLAKEGVDFTQYRENIRKQLTINHLQQRDLESNINVSEQEVDQFLHSVAGLDALGVEYKLDHLLIPLSSVPTPEEVEKAQQLTEKALARLKKEPDFSHLLAADDLPIDQFRVADLGWRKIPELPTLFTDAVPFMKKGAIQGPFRSASGFHIIKLAEKRQAAVDADKLSEAHVKHILIKTNANAPEATVIAKLSQLREDIIENDNFAELAKTFSDDLGSKSNGGDLNWITHDAVVPEFRQVISKLDKGEISQPFQTPFGWHIAQVIDRRQVDPKQLYRKKARQLIRRRKIEEKRDTWLRQLREEAYVHIYNREA